MNSTLKFLKEFIIKPGVTGSIVPSSRVLAEAMVAAANLQHASCVVEFGPGTGAITDTILANLAPGAVFLAIEINPEFARLLRVKYPDINLVQGSATDTRRYLEDLGRNDCDVIISGLPFSTFDLTLQDAIMDTIFDVLSPGGRFLTYSYLQATLLAKGRRFRRKLYSRFSSVSTTPVVWKNVPPAFAYRVVR